MANSKSAIKRIRTAERNRLRNKAYKSALRTLTKKYFSALETYTAEPNSENMEIVNQAMSAAYSKIDKAIKRKVLHRNNGARKKSRLARVLKQATAA
ncbi:MAG: 30S ribosomal protein S20 [Waterburya sp.]